MVNDAEARFLENRKARYESLRDTRKQNESQAFWAFIKSQLCSWNKRLELLTECQRETESEKRELQLTFVELEEELKNLRKLCLSSQPLDGFSGSTAVNEVELIPPPYSLTPGDLRILYNDFAIHQKKFDDVKRRVLPKGKFVFRRYRELRAKQQQTQNDLNQPNLVQSQDMISRTGGLTVPTMPEISGFRNVKILLKEDGGLHVCERCENNVQYDETNKGNYSSSTVILRDIENCDVEMLGFYNAIYMSTVSHTKIKAPNVITGAVHLTNCHYCVLDCQAQQLRIHDSSKLKIHALVSGGAILEDSKDLIFYSSSSLDVRDFNWLRNIPSPNFTIEIVKGEHDNSADKATRVAPKTLDSFAAGNNRNVESTLTLLPNQVDINNKVEAEGEEDDDEL